MNVKVDPVVFSANYKFNEGDYTTSTESSSSGDVAVDLGQYLLKVGDSMTGGLYTPTLETAQITFGDASIQSTAAPTLANFTSLQATVTSLQSQITSLSTNLAPVGAIFLFGGSILPSGYLFCQGGLVLKTQYSALWTAIGSTYLNGRQDPVASFYLPDLRGLFIKGAGNSNTTYNPTNTSTISLGVYQASSVQQHSHTYTDRRWGDSIDVDNNTNVVGNSSSVADNTTTTATNNTSTAILNTSGVAFANETRPNCIGLNYIIKF